MEYEAHLSCHWAGREFAGRAGTGCFCSFFVGRASAIKQAADGFDFLVFGQRSEIDTALGILPIKETECTIVNST